MVRRPGVGWREEEGPNSQGGPSSLPRRTSPIAPNDYRTGPNGGPARGRLPGHWADDRRGADDRARNPSARGHRRRGRHQLVVVAALVGALHLEHAALTSSVTNLARVVATTLFLTAGALRLARWRVTGARRAALHGYVARGARRGHLPLWHLARVLSEDTRPPWLPS